MCDPRFFLGAQLSPLPFFPSSLFGSHLFGSHLSHSGVFLDHHLRHSSVCCPTPPVSCCVPRSCGCGCGCGGRH